MHAGGGFFGNAAPILHDCRARSRVVPCATLLEQVLDDLLFVAAGWAC